MRATRAPPLRPPGLLLLCLLLLLPPRAAPRRPPPPPARQSAGPWAGRPVIGRGHQTLRSSDIEVGSPSSHTDNMDPLTTFSRGGERTLLSITNSAMSATASESPTSYTEKFSSADLSQHSSSMEQSRRNISSSDIYFTEPGTEPLIAHSSEMPTYLSSQSDPPVIGRGHQTLRSSDIEVGSPSSHTDNMDPLTTFSRGGERTLLSITNSAMSATASESPTSYTEKFSSADLSQHSSSMEQSRRNISSSDIYFTEPGTEPLIAHSSEMPTYLSSQSDPPVIGRGHQTLRSSDIEVGSPSSHTDNMDPLTTFSRGGERTLLSITNSAMSATASESPTSYTEKFSSADLSQHSSSMEQSRRNISSSDIYFTEPGTEPLIAHSSEMPTYLSSQSDPPVIGRGHQTLRSSDIEVGSLSSHTDNMDPLTTFSRGGERTLLSITNSAMSATASESPTSYTEKFSSADLSQHSSSVEQSRRNISSSDIYFTEPGTEPLIAHSSEMPTYLSSQSDPPPIGSSHQTVSSWNMEKKTPASRTESVYVSPTFSRGGERTLQWLTNGITLTDSPKSTPSDTEIALSSALTHPSASMSWNRSSTVTDLSESSTGPLFTHSLLKSGRPAIEGSHQPISSSESEKKMASSHMPRMYISTTSTRAGERTLQSIINSSRSSDAKESTTSGTEVSSSSYLTQSSSISSTELTNGINISLGAIDFPEPSTDPLRTHSPSVSETASQAIGSSNQPLKSSATEKQTSDLHTTSLDISSTFIRGGERTLRSQTSSSTSPDVKDSSTSNLENTMSSDLTRPSSSIAQTGGSNVSSSDFSESSMESLPTHSYKIPNYSSSSDDPAVLGSSHQLISISATEKRTSDVHTTSAYISTAFTRGGGRTPRSLTNSSTSPDVIDSSTSYLETVTSSDLTQSSSSVAPAGGHISSSDFSEPSTDPLLTQSFKIPSYLSSTNDLAGIGSSHQTISISVTEKRTSDLHATKTYVSATFTRGGGRTPRSLTNSSTSPDVTDSSTSYLENTTSSDLTKPSISTAQVGGSNISSSDFSDPTTAHSLTRSSKIPSYSSSPNGLAAIGSSHQPISISATEKKTSDLHTTNAYVSTTFTRGGDRTLTSLTNSSTSLDAAESSTSYLENTTSSDLTKPSVSTAQVGGSNISSSDFSDPTTAHSLTRSSKIPSYSSSPNGLAAIGSSHQPISISATEKKTSDLHTTNAYVSTTFTRGGDRTLTSLTNSSTSLDAAESSTSYLENTTSSDLTKPSISTAQVGGSNISSSDFSDPTTAHSLTRSSRIPSYSSSPNGLAAIGSSHQPISISATEKKTSDLHTTNAYVSTTFTRGGDRTLTSLTNSSISLDAAESSTSYLENTTSSDLTQPLSPAVQTGGSNVSSSDFTEPSTESLLTLSSKIPNYSSSPNAFSGIGSSHHPISASATEKRTSHLHTTHTYISTPFTSSGGRTLRSLTNSSASPDVADSSTSYLENITSSNLTQPLSPVAQAGEGNVSSTDFNKPSTELLLTHSSKIPSYSSSPNDLAATRSSHQPVSISATDKRDSASHTTDMYSSTTFTKGGKKTLLWSLTSSNTDAAENSTSNLENTKSSDLNQPLSSVAQTGGSNITSSDFTEPSTEPLLTHSSRIATHSSSSNDLAGAGSSHQLVTVSDREKQISNTPTHSIYTSTTFTRDGERTSQTETPISTSTAATEISTYNIDAAKSSDSTQFLSSVSQVGGFNISSSDANFTEPSTEPLLTHSSKVSTLSPPSDASTIGSSQQSLSSSNTEKRMSSSFTDSMYSSSMLTGSGERTLRSLTNSTSSHTTASSSSYTEIANSSELIQSSSVAQTRGTSISANDVAFTGSSTETFFMQSSKIPTSSSFQNDPSSIPSNPQPVSSIDTEKRISASRTDSMYISTTFNRGGERTLLSISSNSTSAESSESSTFYAEISNSSDLAQASSVVAQGRGNNITSSDGDLIAPSTEPLLVHSSKMPDYTSTVTVQSTTLFYTGTESFPTGSSSLSSSVFPSSSSVSSLYRLLSSTPVPPHSLESSESSLTLSSSVIPSSLPPPSLSSSLSASSSVSSSPSSSSLPAFSPSSSLQDSDSFQTGVSMVTSEGTHRMEPSSAGFDGRTPRQYSNHSRLPQLKESTSFETTGPLSLQTEPMEQVSSLSSSTSASPLITESSARETFTSRGGHFEKTTLLLTTAATSLSENTQHTEMAKISTSILPNTMSQRDVTLTGKAGTLSTDTTFGPLRSVPTTDHSITTKTRTVQTAATTTLAYVTGVTTKAMETSIKITEEHIPAAHPPKTSSPSKTTAGFSTTSAAVTKPTTVLLRSTKVSVTTSPTTVNLCSTNPCLHDGECIIHGVIGKYQCKCTRAWQGEDCSEDVDECLSNPCPTLATCNNTRGSYVCKCPLGYQLEKGKCNLVRTFVAQIQLKLNTTHGHYSELSRIEDETITMLNTSLSTLPGYSNSVVKALREFNSVQVSVQITFSLASNVTLLNVASSLQSYVRACKSPVETCQFISSLKLPHKVSGLCKQKAPECDTDTSECTDSDGIAVCQCKSGYFKYNKMDHSCRACEDGYKLENKTCVSCPFGLGGFNCKNPYQLITVVIAAAGGGLLLILGIALIITCCRKNKNDISKLIFKSGDFQMSPYAEYPKNPRAQDWARETIEMQENGSTKNLLQMTDVYYSPTGLRNTELERNGLYPPYTGLPGSRHSCIYPGQYNLSFISDETRRRDYF